MPWYDKQRPLLAEDGASIDEAFGKNGDPRFGDDAERDLRALLSGIVTPDGRAV